MFLINKRKQRLFQLGHVLVCVELLFCVAWKCFKNAAERLKPWEKV